MAMPRSAKKMTWHPAGIKAAAWVAPRQIRLSVLEDPSGQLLF